MIELDSTLSLELFLDGAVTTTELDFYCSYVDINNTTRAIDYIGFTRGVTTGVTPVTAVAAPDASDNVTRQIKAVIVKNKDTAVATVNIQTSDGVTDTVIRSKQLAVDKSLQMKPSMILLDSGLSIQLFLGGAITTNQLSIYTSYVDINLSTLGTTEEGYEDNISNNTTDVTILTAPAANHIRKLKYLSVTNLDTVAATVTIQVTNGVTDTELITITLDPDETLTSEDGETLSIADSVLQAGDPLSSLDTTVTGSELNTIKTKVDYLTVTQAVDLDTLEARVNALDQAVVFMGSWDASVGTFPTSTNAGEMWVVSVAGTVDGIEFNTEDRILALVDSASTTVYAANWHKNDSSDKVNSVNGATGTVVLDPDDLDDTSTTNKFVTAAQIAAFHDAVTVLDSAEIDFTLTGQQITAILKAGSIDVLKLDAGVQASLGLADSALQSETSHSDVLVDGDFTTNGLMKRTGAGTYAIVTDNSTDWNTAFGWGNHASAGYITDVTGDNLEALANVTITTPSTGQHLEWNGSAWVNANSGSGTDLAEVRKMVSLRI